MKARPYKIIFILLSGCIVCILALQAFWIRNFYLQKMAEFDRTVYATLDQLALKLQEHENLKAIKMTYFIQNGDTIAKTPSRHMTIATGGSAAIINNNTKHVSTRKIVSINEKGQHKVIENSTIISGNGQSINIMLNGTSSKVSLNTPGTAMHQVIEENKSVKQILKKTAGDSKEITKLLDKMLTEIKVLDTEDDNVDTLGLLIKKNLENKGVFTPFEFSVQKLDTGKKVIVQSPGFEKDKPAYKSDLSANKVFNTHNFLFIQFPDVSSTIIRSMKSSLILSALFSLILVAVFYYTIRLILNQKKLSDIKNDFVNNMTHELKTPIATISLAVDGLNNPIIKNDPEKFNEYTRILKEENQKLNRHVERVLQIALLDKGELQLHKTPVNLVTSIQKAINAHALQIIEQKAEVNFTPPEGNMTCYGDSMHVTNVFANLLDNALKYCEGPCHIIITITQHQGNCVVSVKDNGIGIDAQSKEKVFEKFYRVQGGNLHDAKGFGLGLSYARSVIEAHEGSITLHSEKGKGTEFIITLKSYGN